MLATNYMTCCPAPNRHRQKTDRCLSVFEKGTIMKRISAFSLLVALTASGVAIAQSGEMKGMDKMNNQAQGTSKNGTVHRTSAVVKAVWTR